MPDSVLSTPAPNPTPAPSPTGSPTPGSGNGAAAPAPAAWYPETEKGYIESKGWTEAGQLLDSYRNLEKLVGAGPKDLLKKPKDINDVEARTALQVALGRPEKADGYSVPETLAKDPMVAKFREVAFKEGMPAGTFDNVLQWYIEEGGALNTATTEQNAAHQTKRLERLKSEQGPAFEAMLEDGRRAVRTLVPETYKDPATGNEWTREEIASAIEGAIGVDLAVRIMAAAGKFGGEDAFVAGKGVGSGIMSAEAAVVRRNQLRGDKAWGARWAAGDREAREEMVKLDTIIAAAK